MDVTRWRHIDRSDNSADLLTRGVTVADLIHNGQWLHGPSWLALPQSKWSASHAMKQPTEQAITELKVNRLSVFKDRLYIGFIGTAESMPLLECISKFGKILSIY